MEGENMGREDFYLCITATTIKVAQTGGDQTK